MVLAVRVGGGQGPEAIELSVELTTEAEGIEALIERREIHAGSGREDAGGAQALVGGLGPIVDAPDAGTVAVLAAQRRRAKEQRRGKDTIARILAGKRRYVEWLTRRGLEPHPAVVAQLQNPPTIS